MSTLPYARSREEIPLMRFEKTSMEDKIASDQTGRIEYMDVVKVYLRAPGDMKTEVPDIAMRTEYDSIEREYEVEEEFPRKFVNKDGVTEERIERAIVKKKETIFKPRVAFPWVDRLEQQVKANTLTKEQFAKMKGAFDNFMANSEAPVDGTPLSAWTGVNPGIKTKLISMGINTIERLADLNEEGLVHVGMGARDAKNAAISYLQKVGDIDKGATKAVKLEQDNEAMRAQMEEMQNQIRQLTALQQKQDDIKTQAKRGPKKKEAEAA